MNHSNKFKNTAFIGLGSNLDNPDLQINTALTNINNSPNIIIIRKSSLYKTKPYGFEQQNDFVNAVIKIHTSLNPFELLDFLQEIELKQKRKRIIKWGPRTIDLDILAYNKDVINTLHLTIPHPDLKNRGFVLKPWAEIEPEWLLPCGDMIGDIEKQI